MVSFIRDGVHLDLGKDSYDIIVGENLFPKISIDLQEGLVKAHKFGIITDHNAEIHARKLEKILKKAEIKCDVISLSPGEASKNWDNAGFILSKLFDQKYGRDSALIGVGGGMIGDLAGFVSTIFQRGVPFIQVPTTILSQADSAVGGKTGIDFKNYKNSVGRIVQPKRVYSDVDTLATLDVFERRSGLAETVKHGVILSETFFSYLETLDDVVAGRESSATGIIEKIIGGDKETLKYIASKNVAIKGEVVEKDPDEKGLRKVLNYGHTVGHAIESLSEYSLRHGECVSIGMNVAGRISNKMGYMDMADVERQNKLLKRVGLPLTIPIDITNEMIIAKTLMDKKARNGQAMYCLPNRIGEMNDFAGEYATLVPKHIVEKALNDSR